MWTDLTGMIASALPVAVSSWQGVAGGDSTACLSSAGSHLQAVPDEDALPAPVPSELRGRMHQDCPLRRPRPRQVQGQGRAEIAGAYTGPRHARRVLGSRGSACPRGE